MRVRKWTSKGFGMSERERRKELNRGTVGEVVLQEGLVPPVGNPSVCPLHNLGEVLNRTPS